MLGTIATLGELEQIAAVIRLAQGLAEFEQLLAVDEAFGEGDFLGAGDAKALTLLERADEVCRFNEGVGCAGIEPDIAASQKFDIKLAFCQVGGIDVCDFQFPAL